jgi:hypothetical protein
VTKELFQLKMCAYEVNPDRWMRWCEYDVIRGLVWQRIYAHEVIRDLLQVRKCKYELTP